jgi:hypothetical protein
METNEWTPIHGFRSPHEYRSFVTCIDEQTKLGLVLEVEYDATCGAVRTEGERWFRNMETGEVWKLLVPDPGYFQGAWVPVERR